VFLKNIAICSQKICLVTGAIIYYSLLVQYIYPLNTHTMYYTLWFKHIQCKGTSKWLQAIFSGSSVLCCFDPSNCYF